MDSIYNFKGHLLNNGMLIPPVVAEAGPAQRLENDKLFVATDTTYRIIQDAQLVTIEPNWRTYLIQHYDAVIDVHHSLYPKNKLERQIWEQAIEKGWQAGIAQADYLFEQALRRLERDISGIIRYRTLALQGIK